MIRCSADAGEVSYMARLFLLMAPMAAGLRALSVALSGALSSSPPRIDRDAQPSIWTRSWG